MKIKIKCRNDLDEFLINEYSVSPEYPWQDADHAVYRHANNRKWFAVAMTIPRVRLGLEGDGDIEVANLKTNPDMLDWLWQQPGIFPAYHMNKQHWISAALDGSADEELLEGLIDLSYELTAQKAKRK
ncbi:MAG: MmcQ/YjbR family DNA-binding protein [Clostridia bacterium]|nr:MmcQ/YjbR family DNA-binding protein [Clostridia bacterium]